MTESEVIARLDECESASVAYQAAKARAAKAWGKYQDIVDHMEGEGYRDSLVTYAELAHRYGLVEAQNAAIAADVTTSELYAEFVAAKCAYLSALSTFEACAFPGPAVQITVGDLATLRLVELGELAPYSF